MAEEYDSWICLNIALLYEHFNSSSSSWKPYLTMLPSAFETLMFWRETELSELQASAVVDKVGYDDAENLFRNTVLPFAKQHEKSFFPDGNPPVACSNIIELAHRMGSTIMAYAFDLELDEEEDEAEDETDPRYGWYEDTGKQVLGMIPMADMLNADAEFNVGPFTPYLAIPGFE